MTWNEKVNVDLYDYANRLKEANLRTWTSNGFNIKYLLFADDKNVGFVDGGRIGTVASYKFFSRHPMEDKFFGKLLVSEKEICVTPDILSVDSALETLRFYDSGEAERRYSFNGRRFSAAEDYVRAQGRVFHEI